MILNAFFVLNFLPHPTGIEVLYYAQIAGIPLMLMNLKSGYELQVYAPAVMESYQAVFVAIQK